MEARNISKGLGALAAGGWSVATVKGPKWASTREPPGKSMLISMIKLLPIIKMVVCLGY
jgi:hypothetical protein